MTFSNSLRVVRAFSEKESDLTIPFHSTDILFAFSFDIHSARNSPTVCVTRWWVGRESAALPEPT
jgi:hypothetical protein